MHKSVLPMTPQRKTQLDTAFEKIFGTLPQRYFSAPGRTEISGNHTDHQQGRVLAAAVNVDTQAAVAVNGTCLIRVHSKGYAPFAVDIRSLTPSEDEYNTNL